MLSEYRLFCCRDIGYNRDNKNTKGGNLPWLPLQKQKSAFWERFSYGCGDLGCNIIYSAMSAFLLFYYTDYVHVSAATIGTIMLLSRVFDGVTDLIMGVIVDRTKSRFGKCRPWILRMAIPFALAGILLFSVPSGLGETSKLVYIFITYNLVSSVVYTAINVPYATLNALITQNQYERSVLSIFRMILATTGTLLITNLTLPLVQFFGDNLSAWTKTFAVFGILAVIVFMITFTGTKERVAPAKETKQEKVPFLKGIGLLFKNKYWIMITVTLVFIFINYSLNGGAAVYYAKNILHNENMVGTMNLVANLVQIGVMFFTIPHQEDRQAEYADYRRSRLWHRLCNVRLCRHKYGWHHHRLRPQGHRQRRHLFLYVRYRIRHHRVRRMENRLSY